jgi:methionyl-tRNA synthetase
MNLHQLKNRKFFLTPVCLVPNGRAHLGHIAGPLLKMDVLRRHLQRAGADVKMISLSDVHESHVLIKAYNEGTSPAAVADRFHEQIVADLAALNLGYDDLINPLDPAWSGIYDKINRDFLGSIIRAGNAIVRSEPLPILAETGGSPASGGAWRPQVGDPIVSGWLKGRCPHCDQPLVGFFCESCGGHFAPSQMRKPETAYFPGTLRFEQRASLFLNLRGGANAVDEYLRRIRVRSDFLAIARRYLAENGSSIRLTVPSPWGIPFQHPGITNDQVIFSYSALLIACHFVAGERYRQLAGTELNPFDSRSDVTCILSFGIDNAVPFLVGAVGCALAQDHYKPLDHFLVNYFYDLDGSKFSTSRGHLIWGGDIINVGGADVDLVRAYLCWRNPEFGRHTFRADEFLEFHNELGARMAALTSELHRNALGATGWDVSAMNYLQVELGLQSTFLEPDTFDLAAAYSCLERWMQRAPAFSAAQNAAAGWLVGFALLAAPMLPQIAERVWRGMSLTGTPALSILEGGFAGSSSAVGNSFCNLSRTELNVCLPASLRR